MVLVLDAEKHTLAGEGVDDLFLDTFLTLGETLVLGEREVMDSLGMGGRTFPTAMIRDAVGLAVVCRVLVEYRLGVYGGLNLNPCTVTVILTPHLLTAMMSRSLFEAACKAYVQHRHDWVWVEHTLPGFGYMHRTVPLQKPLVISDPLESADDPAAALPPPNHLTCHQSIVFSPTFQVPTFYFSVYDSSA